MKKRLALLFISSAMIMSLAACGASANVGSDEDIKELQERIEELEAENEDLKEELEDLMDEEVVQSEIKFSDPAFEAYYRVASGNLGGPITQEDLDKINYLYVGHVSLAFSCDATVDEYNSYKKGNCYEEYELDNDGTYNSSTTYNIYGKSGDYIKIVSLEDIKHFRNLEVLHIGFDSVNTDFVDSLANLKILDIGNYKIEEYAIAQYVDDSRPDVYIQEKVEEVAAEGVAPAESAAP